MYISGISQLLLTRFGLNFKGKVKARSRQGQGKVNIRSRQCQGEVKARLSQGQDKVWLSSRRGLGKVKKRPRRGQGNIERQGQGKINVRLKQRNHYHNHNYNSMGFDVVEINLVLMVFVGCFRQLHVVVVVGEGLQHLGVVFSSPLQFF